MKNVLKFLVVSIIFFTLNSCTKEASFGEGLNQSSKTEVNGLSSNANAIISSTEANCTWNIRVTGSGYDEETGQIITQGGNSTSVTVNVVKGNGTLIPVMANINISQTNPVQIQNAINFISGGNNGVDSIQISFNGDVGVNVEVSTGNAIRTLSFSPNQRCRNRGFQYICSNVPTQKTIPRKVVGCDI
jgi:hypothetical protein